MKIIQIVTQMEAGGAQRVAYLLTEGLRERGHDAHLWFLYRKRAAYQENRYTRTLRQNHPGIAGLPALGRQLWKDLRNARPDAVMTHTHSANVFAAPIAAAAGVPVRVAVHHNPAETYSSPLRAIDQCAFLTGAYSSMVAVSGGVAASFSTFGQAYQQRLHRIYNAIGSPETSGDFDIRTRYYIPPGMKLLVNVGRLARQKNQSLLLRMLQQIPEAFLLLVGEGEMRRELFAEAAVLGVAERLRFTGELDPTAVNAVLQQADLFVLPSLYESFCLAAVEAMHAGVPVIASDLPCLREVLGAGQAFFPMNHAGALIKIVQTLLHDPAERMRMRMAGMTQAEHFSISRMVCEYELLLAEASLYAQPRPSAADNLRRLQTSSRISRVHDQL